MKKLLFLLATIFSLIISVDATEDSYIIKYRNNAPVFMSYSSDDKSLGAGMLLVSAEKALALKNAGMLEICDKNVEMTYYENTSNDAFYSQQWNIPMIKAPFAWSLETYGNDVLVGIIDSGLAPNHPDIDYSRVIEGYNFGAISTDADYKTNRLDTTDLNGHGTMVAGVIAAKRNNSIGLAGIADKVKIVPMKVENKQGGIYLDSVVWAINAGVGFGCDVLNISLGNSSPYDSLTAAIKNATDAGCIVVCAAGNDTTSDPGDHIRYPAGCEGSISVGSMTRNYTHAESSVVNDSIFISAPADGIPLLGYQNNYVSEGGTSFASPQVAAAAAIAKSINPSLTPSEFADILKNTAYRSDAVNTQEPVRDNEIGYGLLDIEAMIKYMLAGKSVYISPIDDETKSVTLFNLTSSPVTVSTILGGYQNGKMADYDHKPIALASGGKYTHTFTTDKAYNRLRHFLWESFGSLKPYDNDYIPRELLIPAE